MNSSARLGDDVLVRRAARDVAWRAAALVAVTIVLVTGVGTAVVVQFQVMAADTLLRSTVATADDVGDPPPGSWLVLARGAQVLSSPGLPPALAPGLARLRTHPARSPVLAEVFDRGRRREYRVATQERTGQVVQVVFDLSLDRQQRSRLLETMGAAAAVGLLCAVGLGVLLGRRAVRPLAQALGLQRGFIADASHELRTPLTLLSTRAQLLELDLQSSVRQASVPASVLADARGVVQDVGRLAEVVEDLLLAADPRRQQPHEPVDLGRLVVEVVASAAAHAQSAGVQLVATDGSGPVPCLVLGAAPALRRALLALVDNAVDHSPKGGQVRLATRRERREVIVSVSDTGPGLGPQAAKDVLRRFHSGGQRAGRAHYGLGLALTHDVANRHGGQLRLAASLVGAVFELVLPAYVAPVLSAHPQVGRSGV